MGINKKEQKEQTEIEDTIERWKKSRPDLQKKKEKSNKQEGTYVRFPAELRVALQLLAVRKHMGYQTYLKMILADHVEEQIEEGKLDRKIIKKAVGN
jgi:predicted DNA binding CopG/RHH family protein